MNHSQFKKDLVEREITDFIDFYSRNRELASLGSTMGGLAYFFSSVINSYQNSSYQDGGENGAGQLESFFGLSQPVVKKLEEIAEKEGREKALLAKTRGEAVKSMFPDSESYRSFLAGQDDLIPSFFSGMKFSLTKSQNLGLPLAVFFSLAEPFFKPALGVLKVLRDSYFEDKIKKIYG